MSENSSAGQKHPYHLVDPSPLPFLSSVAGLAMAAGLVFYMHYDTKWLLILGTIGLLTVMFLWWRDVVKESTFQQVHTPVVELGLRYGMALFIASEVMFFVAFFWAFLMRVSPLNFQLRSLLRRMIQMVLLVYGLLKVLKLLIH